MQPFVSALGTELGLTSKEIADIIWLALQMQNLDGTAETTTRLESSTSAQTMDDRSRPSPENFTPPSDRNEQPDRASQAKSAEVHLNQLNANQASFGKQLALKVPDARSLREPLSLARSLKPLLRRVVTGWSTVLDEAATVERIADEQLWLPVLKPALEPWLDLALVVDESGSMQIWQRTIAELQRLLSHYGVFRDVRVWGLVTDERGQVQLRPGIGATARRQAVRRPSELIDPSGRRLILVATDCVSSGWHDGSLLPALKLWATSGPLAIVQMLPEWLWSRTGLGFASAVRLQSLLPGVPNQQLVATGLSPWDEVDLDAGIKVPVVTLEPEPFAAWTEMMVGMGGAWSPGFVFEPEAVTVSGQMAQLANRTEGSAEQRVQRFRVTASPTARRLAGLLSAAPVISLPVVRIIQDQLLPESRQVHVAEVFLGGLLKPLVKIQAETNPDTVQYAFLDGVREILLESVPTVDIISVLPRVSGFIAERLGLSLDEFKAVLRNPNGTESPELVTQIRPFAWVTRQILRKLGGEYIQFAEELERSFSSDQILISSIETQLSEIIERIRNRADREKALAKLVRQMPSELLPEVFRLAHRIQEESNRVEVLLSLIQKIPLEVLPEALEIARQIQDPFNKARVLIALSRQVVELLPEAIIATHQISNVSNRADALRLLAEQVPLEYIPHIAEAFQHIRNNWQEEAQFTSQDFAEYCLQRFRVTASPTARKLAGLLAAVPISLPIIRIIQSQCLPESQQIHVVEVFLGGLLKPLLEVQSETEPDEVKYEFFDGIREKLLDSVPVSDTVKVLDEIAKFVAEGLGLSMDRFESALRDPRLVRNQEVMSQLTPFARISAQVLRQLGGEYTELAYELEQLSQINPDTNLSSLQNIQSYVEIISDIRMDLSARITQVIELRRIFAEHTDSIRKCLMKILNLIQNILQDDNSASGDLKDLEKHISEELFSLQRLIDLFKKRFLSIGVVGLPRQGKSTFLQRSTGLTDQVLPARIGHTCTAVPIKVCHHDANIEALVTFHSEKTFLDEVIYPYYRYLFPSISMPKTLQEFELNELPFKELENASQQIVYKHLQDDYYANLQHYRSYLGTDSSLVKSIGPQEIERFVVHQQDDFSYLAVKEVNVRCRFPLPSRQNLQLIDLPGLGDTWLGNEERIMKILSHDVDIVIFIRRPDPFTYGWNRSDLELYDLVNSALPDTASRSFMILNQVKMHGNDNEIAACRQLLESANGKGLRFVDYIIADCSDHNAVNDSLDRVLNYAVSNSLNVDSNYLRPYLDHLLQFHHRIGQAFKLLKNDQGKLLAEMNTELLAKINTLSTSIDS